MHDTINQLYDSKRNASAPLTVHPDVWRRDGNGAGSSGNQDSEVNESASERELRVQTALQAIVPGNKEEARAGKLIHKGQQDQLKAKHLQDGARKEKPEDASGDLQDAADILKKANKELDRGCTEVEESSGYTFERFNGQLSIAYKALPVRQEDFDRLRREAEMRDPLGERMLRTAGHVARSTGDFAKGACYGALAWPDIAEYQLTDKKTARQWGYMAGSLVNLSPVPFLPTMTEGVGLAAHIVHGVHQHMLEKEEAGPDKADLARRAKEMRDPLDVRVGRTLGRVSRSVGDFTKSAFYGGLSLPDKGEDPPDEMPTARQLGYAMGHLTITSVPVPFLSMGTNLFGMGAHVVHDANQTLAQHPQGKQQDEVAENGSSIGQQNSVHRKKNPQSSKGHDYT